MALERITDTARGLYARTIRVRSTSATKGNDSASEHALSKPVKNVVFTDENARIAWQVSQDVERVAQLLPPEVPNLRTKPVRFTTAERQRGMHAALTAGTVIGTGDPGVLLLPERTLRILDTLGIPFEVVTEK